MSKRFWRFSLVVLAGTVVIAGTMAIAYRSIAVDNLREMRAEQNVQLARSLSNTLGEDFRKLATQAKSSSWMEMQQSSVVADVAESILQRTEDLSILRVNIFSPDGLTLYSSDRERIGVRVPDNPGIESAAHGTDISRIVRNGTLSEFDRVIENQDLIESYVPLRDKGGNVIGVFEVHSDITPLVARIAKAQSSIIIGVFGLMSVLYLLLIYLYRKLEVQFTSEQSARQESHRLEKKAKREIEVRVHERTTHLREERDLMRRALDVLGDPAIVVDPDRSVSFMNKAARERYGDMPRDGSPVMCHKLLHGADDPCAVACSRCSLSTGIGEIRLVEQAGGQVTEFRAMPIVDESGQTTAVIELQHDLSDQERQAFDLRNQKNVAESSSRAKSELVATISHEIRTPLNAVLGMTDLLNLTNLTRKQRGYIQTIQSSGDMLLSLVDNLLDFSELEHGALSLVNSEFDIIDLLERVLRVMGHSASSKGLELVGTIGHDLGLRVSADQRRLRQILVNVVNNAVKFTDSGEVVIAISADELRDDAVNLKFVITDTGIGIDDETREKLFVAFGSSLRPASSQTYGSGLGLTICKKLLDNMGGQILLESRLGGGTVVTIEVPATRVPSHIAEDLAATETYQPKRVLGLLANQSAAKSVCNYLGNWHIECETVMDADEGLHRLRAAASGATPFECAIIDSSLTEADGLSLVRRIRKSPEVAELPVVLLTSITKPLAIGEVSVLGRVRCVNKPVLPLELRYSLLRVYQDSRPAESQAQPGIGSGQPAPVLRVLIAEDNPVSSAVLNSMLGSLGYDADVVNNGPDVLDALTMKNYHLLLLDCQMPGMDGDMVTREIRKNPERYGDNAVIVAVTADTTERHRAQCLEAGMDFFMPKPVRLEKLRAGIGEWAPLIDERSGADENADSRIIRRNLEEMTGLDDDSFISGYIDLFLTDAENRLSAMVLALENGDVTTIRREGHALKGACLELGADRLARYCQDLSSAARGEDLKEAQMVLRKIAREYIRLRPVYESAAQQVH